MTVTVTVTVTVTTDALTFDTFQACTRKLRHLRERHTFGLAVQLRLGGILRSLVWRVCYEVSGQ